jgi:hypothetical protein
MPTLDGCAHNHVCKHLVCIMVQLEKHKQNASTKAMKVLANKEIKKVCRRFGRIGSELPLFTSTHHRLQPDEARAALSSQSVSPLSPSILQMRIFIVLLLLVHLLMQMLMEIVPLMLQNGMPLVVQ